MSAGADLYYGLQIRSGMAASTVALVNGVPYPPVPEGQAGGQSLAIHADVLPGANIVELLIGGAGIAPDAPPRRIQGAPPEALFAVLLLEGDHVRVRGDEVETDTEELDRAEWRPSASEEQAVQLPHRLSLSFVAPTTMAPPNWAAARPVEGAAVQQEVLAALRTLHGLIAARDWDGYANRVALRYRDAARAFPLGPSAEVRRQADVAMLAEEAGRDGFTLLPFPMGGFAVRTYAGGRLVEAVRADGGALVQATVAGERIDFHTRFSMLADGLTVTR